MLPSQTHAVVSAGNQSRYMVHTPSIVFDSNQSSSSFQAIAPFLKDLFKTESEKLAEEFIQKISQKTGQSSDPLTGIFRMVIHGKDQETLDKACYKSSGYFSRLFSSESWEEWSERRTALGRVVSAFKHYATSSPSFRGRVLARFDLNLVQDAVGQAAQVLQDLSTTQESVGSFRQILSYIDQRLTFPAAAAKPPLSNAVLELMKLVDAANQVVVTEDMIARVAEDQTGREEPEWLKKIKTAWNYIMATFNPTELSGIIQNELEDEARKKIGELARVHGRYMDQIEEFQKKKKPTDIIPLDQVKATIADLERQLKERQDSIDRVKDIKDENERRISANRERHKQATKALEKSKKHLVKDDDMIAWYSGQIKDAEKIFSNLEAKYGPLTTEEDLARFDEKSQQSIRNLQNKVKEYRDEIKKIKDYKIEENTRKNFWTQALQQVVTDTKEVVEFDKELEEKIKKYETDQSTVKKALQELKDEVAKAEL